MDLYPLVPILAFIAFLFLSVLWGRRKNRELHVQIRRFPAFALRDQFVRFRIEGKIPDQAFDQIMSLCNGALALSEHVDEKFLFSLAKTASQKTEETEFQKTIVRLAKSDRNFLKAMEDLLGYIIARALWNSMWRFPQIIWSVVRARSIQRVREGRRNIQRLETFKTELATAS